LTYTDIAGELIAGKIAKSQLPQIAARLNRRDSVLRMIPDLEADLDGTETTKSPKSRTPLYMPADFTLYFTFGASTRIDWGILPQRNILVSGYNILHRTGKQAMVIDMINKRDSMDSLMIASAAIVSMSKGDISWFDQQPALVEFANAVDADVVSHLDVLCKPKLLEACKLTVAEAQAITIRNAEQMLDLKTKARKCFVLQGHEAKEYDVCINAYADLGIFDDNKNIIGIGSVAGERRQTTVARYKHVSTKVHDINPNLEMHAFGIGSPDTLVKLYEMHVRRVDNQTPNVLTRINQWIDARTGEPAKNVRLCDNRNTGMYQSQLLFNYASYHMGISNEFKRQGYPPV